MNETEQRLERSYWIQYTISNVLKLALQPLSLKEQLERTLDLILAVPWLSLEAKGGVYLVSEDEENKLALIAQRNLPDTLLKSCTRVPFGHCLCGRAAATRQIIFAGELDQRHETRYEGIHQHGHYCVPILSAKRLLGVINLYVSYGHQHDSVEEEFLNAIANTLAGVIERKRAEEALQQAKEELEITVENLKLSLEPISLKEQMKRTLDLILSIPWLSLEAKGCIFLVSEDGTKLELFAEKNLPAPLLDTCATIALGDCLCGRTAACKEIIFAECLDGRHSIRYEGMHEHGHYCAPILFGKTLLGVINMYVTAGHKKTKTEEDFIVSIANTLAGVIERKKAEEALQKAKNELELTVRKRTDKLKQLHQQNKLILDAAAEGICGVNREGRITFINPAVLAITGYTADDLVGRDFHAVFHFRDFAEEQHDDRQCPIVTTIATGRTSIVSNTVFWRKDNSGFPVEYEATPMREKGAIIGAVIIFRDITERKQAEEDIKRSLTMLKTALHGTVDALSSASETRDPYTAGHQRRVTQLACAIAEKMQLDAKVIDGMRVAALLHDIGKIYVPAEFLSKPGKLSEIERDLLKTHPQVGYDILKNIDFPWPVAEIVLQHHEKIDGSGYPRGLAGKEILLEARIVAVADIIEAMASHRPYRPSLGIEAALREIREKKSTLYDPEIVDVCMKLFSEKEFQFDLSE
jgi:PAS domain S-box-containing protein/putative nucleotidyltransferase with HDIG domain